MHKSLFSGTLALIASAAFASPLPDAVPLEVFAELPSIEHATLSPDGKSIAGKMAIGDRQLLVTQNLFGGKPAIRADGGVDINWWRWVNDDWLVIGIGDDQVLYGDKVYVTRVVGASADMTKVRLIDAERSGIEADDVIWVAQDGSPRFLLAKSTGIEREDQWYPSVFDVDVSSGRAKQIVASIPDVWEWHADASGTVRYGEIWRDGKRKGLMYRGSADERFSSVAPRAKDVDSIPTPAVFRPDGSALAFDDRDGRDGVYELALPSFTLGRRVFGSARYDVDDIVLNSAHNDAAGFTLIEKRPRVEWLDPDLKETQQALDKTLGAGNSRIISWSRDRKTLLVEVGGPSQAGAIYYWNTDGAEMQRFAWNNTHLKNRVLSPVSTIEYKARDGTLIEAVLTLPRGRQANNLPLIVMPHGGPRARDSESYDWWVQFLAEQGYAVVQPNYRGSIGYGTSFRDLGKGQWGLKMQDDLVDAIDLLAKQGTIDAKRVCIVGASYGGYAAMRAAQRDYPHYRCAVSYAGISDMNAMLKYDRNTLGKGVIEYWKAQAPDFTSVSPRFHAAEFGTPILIAHGVVDKRVPVKQSRLLVSELQKAGKPYEYLEQKLGDHHFSRGEDRLEFLKRLKAFLDKYNPA